MYRKTLASGAPPQSCMRVKSNLLKAGESILNKHRNTSPCSCSFFTTPFDRGATPLHTLTNSILNIMPPNKIPSKELSIKLRTLTRVITHYCLNQHIQDPPMYVSHDFRHSLRVYHHMTTLFNKIPTLSAITKLKHNLPDHLITFNVALIPILHDIGYPNQMTKQFQKSKYRKNSGFGSWEGPILLQDHYDPVWYRNLKVRKL